MSPCLQQSIQFSGPKEPIARFWVSICQVGALAYLFIGCHSVRTLVPDIPTSDGAVIPDAVVILDQTQTEEESLVDHNAWTVTDVEQDPLADHRPEEIGCPPGAFGEEQGTFEVETGYCNYIAVSQPSALALEAGDQVHITLWHNDLSALEPYEAHIAILIDGDLIWEATTDVPHAAAVYDVTVPIVTKSPAGSVVQYHLHNHGFNSWNLLYINRVR